jgi:DNA invertase Pin-like site-specific DNA recombinase
MKKAVSITNTHQTDNSDVISLLRVSTLEQASEGRSGIERQREINNAAALFHGVRIIREIEAKDVSGRHVMQDPDFQQLFRELRTNTTLKGVLISEHSRLFRPEYYDFSILEEFRVSNKKILTPESVIDPTTDEGRMTLILNGMMSGAELKRIRDRMNSGKQRDRKAGKHPGGKHLLPRGVRYIRPLDPATGRLIKGAMGRWEYDGVDSERVKQMFELFLAGRSYQDIAAEIGGWTGAGVKGTLQNPVWIGTRAYRYKPHEYTPKGQTKPKRRSVRREDPLEVEIPLPALISREVWERVQEMIARRSTTWRKRRLKKSHRAIFLLSGLGRCTCGKSLYASYGSHGPGADRYLCASRKNDNDPCGAPTINRQIVDETLVRTVSEQLTDTSILKAIFDRTVQSEPNEASDARAKLQRLKDDIRKRRQRVIQNFEDGDITRDQKREKLKALDGELHRLDLECPPAVAMPRHSVRDICRAIVEVFADFRRLPFERQRETLFRAVREVIVDTRNRSIPTLILNGNWLDGAGANCERHIERCSCLNGQAGARTLRARGGGSQ